MVSIEFVVGRMRSSPVLFEQFTRKTTAVEEAWRNMVIGPTSCELLARQLQSNVDFLRKILPTISLQLPPVHEILKLPKETTRDNEPKPSGVYCQPIFSEAVKCSTQHRVVVIKLPSRKRVVSEEKHSDHSSGEECYDEKPASPRTDDEKQESAGAALEPRKRIRLFETHCTKGTLVPFGTTTTTASLRTSATLRIDTSTTPPGSPTQSISVGGAELSTGCIHYKDACILCVKCCALREQLLVERNARSYAEKELEEMRMVSGNILDLEQDQLSVTTLSAAENPAVAEMQIKIDLLESTLHETTSITGNRIEEIQAHHNVIIDGLRKNLIEAESAMTQRCNEHAATIKTMDTTAENLQKTYADKMHQDAINQARIVTQQDVIERSEARLADCQARLARAEIELNSLKQQAPSPFRHPTPYQPMLWSQPFYPPYGYQPPPLTGFGAEVKPAPNPPR